MDRITQIRHIDGNFAGNTGSHNVIGNQNIINNFFLPDGANLVVGSQSGVLGTEGGASRPYRLIPYGRNSVFTGRENLIRSVRRSLEPLAHNRIALYGLGGCGKTQIALEYVYQCTSESDCSVLWVQGSGIVKFREGFEAVAQRVQIPAPRAEAGEEGFLLSIRAWFEGPNSGNWILVIDNADNDADFAGNSSPIAKFVPQGTKGTVIFTTRSRQVGLRQGCKMISVGKMGEDEAQELFAKRFGGWDSLGEEEREVVARILDSVDHLPLAVVGSAAFMSETGTSPSLYWGMFQENDERAKKLLSQEFSDIQREVDMSEGILGTYFITFDRISQQTPLAAGLLRLIAFFDRQNIPEELLTQCGLKGVNDLVEFRRAVGKLLGFSLVTSVAHEDKTFYELHRLVQLSIQVYLPTSELRQWRGKALRVVSQLFPQDDNEWRDSGPTYIAHALAVTKGAAGRTAEKLGHRMGLYFLDIGSYNNAEMQFRRCIALREQGKAHKGDGEGRWRFTFLGWIRKRLGSHRQNTLRNISHLALALERQGRYDEAVTINWRALEGYEKVLGSDHPDTLTSVSNLALLLKDQGKYDESETMNRRALEGCEKVLGSDHPDTLTSINNLASVLQDQGKYDESETMNRRALEGSERVLGSDHPDTLASVTNLASVLQDQGKYEESETMNRRALEGCEKVLGSDHPSTLASVTNLASVLQDQGKYEESETMNRQALDGYEKVLGSDHPSTLTSTNNLALVLQDQGKYDESEMMNRRALEGREKVLGSDHPDTLTSVSNLASLLQFQGKYDESEAMNRRALEGREKVLGLDHPDTLISVSSLASVLRHQGKYEESETMNRQALEGREKVLGSDHPDTLTSVSNLALVLQGQGKYTESETMNRQALDGYEKLLGSDHPSTLTSVSNLASVVQQQGKYEESETMNRRALEGREKVLGSDHPDTLLSLRNLISVLQHQGRHDELEALNRRAR